MFYETKKFTPMRHTIVYHAMGVCVGAIKFDGKKQLENVYTDEFTLYLKTTNRKKR